MIAKNYIVSVIRKEKTGEQRLKESTWDASKPFAVDFPIRWVLERSESGVRVRNLTGKPGEVRPQAALQVGFEQLHQGAAIELEPGTFVQLREARVAKPFYEEFGSRAEGSHILIASIVGNVVVDTSPLTSTYNGTISGSGVFKILARGEDGFVIQCFERSLELRLPSGVKKLNAMEEITLRAKDLVGAEIVSGQSVWKIGRADSKALSEIRPEDRDEEASWLRKQSLRAAALMLLFFIVGRVAFHTEEMKPEEKPAEVQYAKVKLNIPKRAAEPVQAVEKAPDMAPDATNTVAKAPVVVQAKPESANKGRAVQTKVVDPQSKAIARAQAMEKKLAKMMSGGLASMIKNSGGSLPSAAPGVGGLMNGGAAAAPAGKIEVAGGVGNADVSGIGGRGIANEGNGTGGSVGYGKGEHARVQGNGGRVHIDIAGAFTEEGLTRDEVGAVIHKHMNEVRYCYESAMLRQSKIEGKLVVGFTVDGKGVVKRSKVNASSLNDSALDDCVMRRLVTWRFPKPKGGVDVDVSYPFIFRTLGAI